jgi:PAS domain S-box-containing protein
MFIWWGEELICFYNDAYRPSLGNEGKHPGILGKPAKEAWPEIWDTISPLIKGVLDGGEATWSEDQLIPIYRNGQLEDVYWTFSYSAIIGEEGNVAGVLVTCVETTAKVLNLKMLTQSKDELQFAIDATELGTFDYNPITKKFAANKQLKEWFGLSFDKDIELTHAIDAIIPEDKARVTAAIEAALMPSHGGLYDVEYTIVHPVTGRETIVRAKGKAWFAEGIAYRFNGTLQDVTVQAMARKKIEESEARFRNIVRQAPLGITILKGDDHVVEMANATYLELIDRTEDKFIGKPLYEVLPEVKESIEELLKGVLQDGKPFYGYEFPVTLNRYGKIESCYFNFVYHPLRELDGRISGIMVVAMEVTTSVNTRHALTESEKQFKNLVMQSPIPMTIFRGADHKIEIANRVMYEKIWRKKESEIMGRPALEVFPELKDQKYEELLKHVMTTGETYRESESIAYIMGDDGMQKFYLDFEYAPLREPDGAVSGIFITVNDVTEKVAARTSVEESEKRFRNVADNAPVLIGMSGPDKQSHYFNKAWLNYTGRTAEQETGSGWMDGIHADDIERFTKMYNESFDKRVEFYIEFQLKRHDGKYRWISDYGVPRFTSDGEFEGYICASMDIHEQVIYQKKLKEDEARLNIVISASELGTWEFEPKTLKGIYSERFLTLFDIDDIASVKHASLVSRIHPDDLKVREAAFKVAYATGQLYYEARVVWRDKSVHWIEVKGRVFYDEANQPDLLIGTIRDTTEEKNYQQRLLQREQKFRLLADSMPQFVWTGDAEGNLDYFNQSVYEYAGMKQSEATTGNWLQIVHPDDREENVARWMDSVRTGNEFKFEHRFLRADGEYRWQQSRAIPQRDSNGTIQMWVGTSTDIQDQKIFTNELERQVRERTTELEQKNRELGKMNSELEAFAYVSSHDLQEPLRKIQTFASRILQKEQANLSDSGKDYFQRMQNAAQRMQTLIEDLLAYSRTSTTERVFRTINLNDAITEVKNDLKEVLAEKNATVEVGTMCELNIIPFQFRQLLNNLFTNSLKFSREGVPPVIKIGSRMIDGSHIDVANILPHKTYCHISVSDNGIGFEPQYSERIFEVFQRLHGKDEYKGTGIGLAIVKKIVDNHNGVITASGEVDKGATFDIYIPVS